MPRKKRAYHHGDLRQALLDAAVSFIAARGVDALSLRGLARHAGVSPAAPYHHFASKEELLGAIATDGFERLGASMRAARDHAESEEPPGRLRAIGEAYVRFALDHPAHFHLMFRPGALGLAEDDPGGARAAGFSFLLDAALEVVALPEVGARVTHAGLVVLAWSVVHGAASLLLDGPLAKGIPEVGVLPGDVPSLATRTLEALTPSRAALRKAASKKGARDGT